MSTFFSFQKTILKSWLDTFSTPPQYFAICRAFQAFFLSQSWQLLDTWWIDWECFCLLNSSSTFGGSMELLFLNLILCCSILAWYFSCRGPVSRHLPRQLPWHLSIPHLSSITLLKVLFKLPSRSVFHFFDLSRFVRASSSPKHSLFHSQPLPQGFFKLFQVFLHLVSF